MPVTRDASFPEEVAQLVDTCNRCCEGHKVKDVREAAAQFLIAAIVNATRLEGGDKKDMVGVAAAFGAALESHCCAQWDRQPRADDVLVRKQ